MTYISVMVLLLAHMYDGSSPPKGLDDDDVVSCRFYLWNIIVIIDGYVHHIGMACFQWLEAHI